MRGDFSNILVVLWQRKNSSRPTICCASQVVFVRNEHESCDLHLLLTHARSPQILLLLLLTRAYSLTADPADEPVPAEGDPLVHPAHRGRQRRRLVHAHRAAVQLVRPPPGGRPGHAHRGTGSVTHTHTHTPHAHTHTYTHECHITRTHLMSQEHTQHTRARTHAPCGAVQDVATRNTASTQLLVCSRFGFSIVPLEKCFQAQLCAKSIASWFGCGFSRGDVSKY